MAKKWLDYEQLLYFSLYGFEIPENASHFLNNLKFQLGVVPADMQSKLN